MRKLEYGNSYLAVPIAIVHPMAMTEGGLSAVETRAFLELAECAGAKRAITHVGRELSDDEVQEMARAV